MMKKYLLFFIALSSIQLAYGQTYLHEFNKIDDSNGYSLNSNVNGSLHWGESVILENYLNMYKATNSYKYLFKVVLHIKRMQERRDDNLNNINNQLHGIPSNIALSPDEDCPISINPTQSCIIQGVSQVPVLSKGWSYVEKPCECLYNVQRVLHSATITFPMAEFIYLIKTNIALQQLPLPAEALGSYLGATNLSTFLDFANWLQIRVNETIQFHDANWCIDPDQIGYHHERNGCISGRDAFNMQCAMGRTLAMMYLVESLPDGNSTNAILYNMKLSAIAAMAEAHIDTFTYDPDAYTWQHRWVNPLENSVEDITHAWLAMSFADICFTYGIPDQNNKYFWSTDMAKFAKTMTNYIYQSPLNFALNTAGTNNVNTDQLEGGSSYNALNALGPYVFLSKYDPNIYQILSDAYFNNPNAAGGALSAYPQLALYQHIFNPVGIRRNTFADSHWAACAGGDFNGDGNEEFATLRNKDGSVEVYSLDNSGNINQQNTCPNSYANNWAGVAAGNIDGAGADEMVAVNNDDNTIYVFNLSNNIITQIGSFYTNLYNWKGIACGNLINSINGDEIVAIKENGFLLIYSFSNNQFVPVISTQTNLNNAVGITIGEFDIDNPGNEIAIINNGDGHLTIYKLDNSNGYSLQLINSFTAASGTYNEWNGLTSGDFDNDGIDEIVAHRNYDGDFFVFKITNGQLLNNYIEYFPTDTQHGVIGTMKYKGKDALIALRNYDGNMFAFTLDGYCKGLEVSSDITQESTIDNSYSNVSNAYTIDYHSDNTLIAADMTVSSNGAETVKVEFVSGKEIIFKPGFKANEGVVMDAYIDHVNLGCDNNFNLKTAHQPSTNPNFNQSHELTSTRKESELKASKVETSTLSLQINPNPNEGQFTLQFNKPIHQGMLTIYDCLSKPIATYNLSNNATFMIDISSEAKGIYIVHFNGDDLNTVKRVVKN